MLFIDWTGNWMREQISGNNEVEYLLNVTIELAIRKKNEFVD